METTHNKNSRDKRNGNILLFLSPYSTQAEEYSYSTDEETVSYTGEQTNDAPVKYLINQIYKTGSELKRVICITSHKIFTEKIKDDQTQYERFQSFVKQEVLAAGGNPDQVIFDHIPYDFVELPESAGKSVVQRISIEENLPNTVFSKLSEWFKNRLEYEAVEDIYIDYTGGFRDISFLMTSIIRFLEILGLSCKGIVYSNNQQYRIYDIHYIYDLYQVIHAVETFINTGNVHELKAAYQEFKSGSFVSKAIAYMITLSDTLSVSATDNLDETVKSLIKTLNGIENEHLQKADIKYSMFRTLIPIIKEKMYLNDDYDYTKMVRWCAENNMVQQAAVIFVEKLPELFFDRQLAPIEKPECVNYANEFYDVWFARSVWGYETLAFMTSIKSIEIMQAPTRNEIIQKVDEQIKKLEDNNEIKKGFNRLKAYIGNNYDKKLNRKENVGTSIKPYGEDKSSPGYRLEFDTFWEKLGSPEWCHFFVRYDRNEYEELTKIAKVPTSVRERLDILNALSCSIHKDKPYVKFTAYYFAVKFMRNMMSHAIQKKKNKEEIKILNKTNLLSTDFKVDLETYKKILIEGIDILQ